MRGLAAALDFFNDVDDDETLRLYEQSIVIVSRVEGSPSVNLAVGERNWGLAYINRADRAQAVNDLDRCMANLELPLPKFAEAARIFRAINFVDKGEEALRRIVQTERDIRRIEIIKAAAVVEASAVT